MTFVEFFEKDAIENICSCLTKTSDRVVLLGDKTKLMKKHAERYKAILSARGVDVDFICRSINKNEMQSIIDALASIVEEYDDCVFDLTGGEDLYLVATGIVFERYKNKNIQMHRFNIGYNTIIDCDQDGHTILTENAPKLTNEENIQIYGGDIIYEEEKDKATYLWNMSEDFKKDINAMWKICRRNVRLWNTQICVFEDAEKFRDSTQDELTISVPTNHLKVVAKQNGGSFVVIKGILDRLYRAGLLKEYRCDDELFSLTYKNEQVKRCLTIAGKALEMKVYLTALETKEKDGSKTYNDVMNGVYIDWDGDLHTGQDACDTDNEIDVMMMHGMVPVFISCKNGYVEMNELYKLNTVATRFGGKYAKKVLVATALADSGFAQHLRQRAEDMGIRLVEGYSQNGLYKDFTEMNDDEIKRVMRSLWSN